MQLTKRLHAFVWNSLTTNNCNTYFIDGPMRVLIDPGHSNLCGHVERGLDQLGLTMGDVDLVLCTHSHPDHVEAAQQFTDRRALFALHEASWQFLNGPGRSLCAVYGFDPATLNPDFFLKEGTFSTDGLDLEILHTPGHSPGSICLYWPSEKALITGDLVFEESFGRIDLPGGNADQLKESIRRVAGLDAEWLLPGHGNVMQGARKISANFDYLQDVLCAYL